MSLKILQIEAKDIYIAQLTSNTGYQYVDASHHLITDKFKATLPDSIELSALRTAYIKTFRNKRFSVEIGHHSYTTTVLSLKFSYAVKQFNRHYGGVFIKLGYSIDKNEIADKIAVVRNGDLVAIKCGVQCDDIVDDNILNGCFVYDSDDKCYKEAKNKTIVSTGELRKIMYEDGIVVGGQRYVRWMRSSGAARLGKVLFIIEALSVRMRRFDLAGIKVQQGEPIDLPSLEAYMSLASSGIIGTIDITPKNILLVDDYNTTVRKEVMYVENDDKGRVQVEKKFADVDSCVWDGMCLLDESAFGDFSEYSFILLRNRFFKSAALKTRLQEFFTENGITSIEQLNGKTLAKDIKDVLLICTPTSVKYMKFGTFEEFCNNVEGSKFSVVKHDKPSKPFGGRMAECNYQVLNSINFTNDELKELMKPTTEYIHAIKTDPAVMRYHVRSNIELSEFDSPIVDRAEIVSKLLASNKEFSKTKMYKSFCDDITGALSRGARRGRLLVNGSFLTMFGNPVELLLHSIGKFDGSCKYGEYDIFTYRHPFDREYVGARSPHICSGSLAVFKNVYMPEVDKWFYVNKNIMVVNAINTDIQSMLNGADWDSDVSLVIDNDIILKAVKRDYDKFGVPVNGIGSAKNKYRYTLSDIADLDRRTFNRLIAKICNLAQVLQSMMFHEINSGAPQEIVDEIYKDLSFLSVLSGLAIDSAKRVADVDIAKCLRDMQQKYVVKHDGRKVMPAFFRPVLAKKHIDASNIEFRYYQTTMDRINTIMNKSRCGVRVERNDSMSAIVDKDKVFSGRKSSQRTVYYLRDLIRSYSAKSKAIWADPNLAAEEKRDRYVELKDELIQYISGLTITDGTAYRLVCMLDNPKCRDISKYMFTVLFASGVPAFYRIINQAAGGVEYLEEDDNGNIEFYGIRFSKVGK